MNRPCLRLLAALAAAVAIGGATAAGESAAGNPIAAFSAATPGGPMPAGWIPLAFPHILRHTAYSLVRDPEAGVVVRAEARASASGLIERLDLPAADWLRLSWRWKFDKAIVNGDVTRREGDDYPARVYVSFRYAPERVSPLVRLEYAAMRLLYGESPPHAGLNYIWDAHASVGTVAPNPYSDRVRMIVVESGTDRVGRWLAYERDVVADYRAAFGEDPPPISGVGLMTDADDTGESALAYYGDIALSRAPATTAPAP